MGHFKYLIFFLLPFSFGLPNKSSKEGSLVSPIFSLLPKSKPVVDIGCKENEHFSFCSAHCQHNCSNLGVPIDCSDRCVSGCVCDDGYVRGLKNDCISIKECNPNRKEEELDDEDIIKLLHPMLECPEKEIYSWCNAHCQSNCATLKNPEPCSDECVSGCICKAGFVRDLEGKCVPTERCILWEKESAEEDFCPPNEVFSPCLAHCQKNCSNWSDPTMPCLKICVPGCICDFGMVRGPYGNCIRPRTCPDPRSQTQDKSGDIPIDCPVNEHLSRCKAHCQKNCSNWDQDIKCSRICVSGCICDKDFVRGPSGKCILPEKCSSLEQKATKVIKKKSFQCPKGEQKSDLKSIGDSNIYCRSGDGTLEFCPPTYLKGCVCEKGQIRGDDNQCSDRRLNPNANEIHLMPGFFVHQGSDKSTENNSESSDLKESREEVTFDSTTYQTLNPDEDISSSTNIYEEMFSTITHNHEQPIEHLLNSDFDTHGCPDNQKCFEWCRKGGYRRGICLGTQSKCRCFSHK